MTGRLVLLVGCAFAATSGGCMVSSQCLADYDCSATERCCGTPMGCATGASAVASGECFVECRKDSDCWPDHIADNGKKCIGNRCEFRFDERVAALNFCLTVVNPGSGRAGKQACLADLKGQVVLLYFGWIT